MPHSQIYRGLLGILFVLLWSIGYFIRSFMVCWVFYSIFRGLLDILFDFFRSVEHFLRSGGVFFDRWRSILDTKQFIRCGGVVVYPSPLAVLRVS